MARGSSSRRQCWSRDLEEVREGAPWVSRERSFQEEKERTASIKALGWGSGGVVEKETLCMGAEGLG